MVLKRTRTEPEPLKYFEQELNLNPNRYLNRFDTLLLILTFSIFEIGKILDFARSGFFLFGILSIRDFVRKRLEPECDSNPCAIVGRSVHLPLDHASHNVALSKCRI